ncbi:hypothetical protein Ahy_A09g043024 [Arachis hypogaea]|uniref:CCT domain-containing protein n=1 Tax=Arachis hypogaea TaxID=3818 RepID=A0A445BHC2_ARAHY|nr:hypothetical protein Ahy_A09g043024 [Arachis hypogaea]
MSIIFDSQEELDNDISASIDFSSSPAAFNVPPMFPVTTNHHQEQFDFSSMHHHHHQIQQLAACSVVEGFSQYPTDTSAVAPPPPPLMGAPQLPSVFEEDCISSAVPSYVTLNPSSPSCSYLNPAAIPPPYMPPAGPLATALSADRAALFTGSMLLGSELQRPDLEYQGENGGIYCTDSIHRVFNPQELQYACRKTLADSRPRVRGRFAKNDDFGDAQRPASSNHEEEDEEEVVVKEEDDMVDSSDIFAHISGVNSFKCNYSIQSWI